MSSFSITARAPITQQAANGFHDRLLTESERFTITAGIGFDQASVIVRGSEEYLLRWFRGGLARDVAWRGPNGSRAWEGYVSGLTLTIGGSQRRRTLAGMANRLLYSYAELDTSTNPPQAKNKILLTLDDADSQAAYPVKMAAVSGGQRSNAAAATAAASELEQLARIDEDGSDALGGGDAPSLQIDMRGYAWLLEWSLYRQVASSGTIGRSDLIEAIVAADPNGVLSADLSGVTTNSETRERYQEDPKPSWGLIQEIAEEGGASGRRWVAGVYERRRLIYKEAEAADSRGYPLNDEFGVITRSLHDAGERFFERSGREVAPWELRPDRLVQTYGLSKRPEYIQQVGYDAPYGLQLRATDANPLRGKLL